MECGIIDRHARHFVDFREEDRDEESWEELKGWAWEHYTIDLKEVLTEGLNIRKHGLLN